MCLTWAILGDGVEAAPSECCCLVIWGRWDYIVLDTCMLSGSIQGVGTSVQSPKQLKARILYHLSQYLLAHGLRSAGEALLLVPSTGMVCRVVTQGKSFSVVHLHCGSPSWGMPVFSCFDSFFEKTSIEDVFIYASLWHIVDFICSGVFVICCVCYFMSLFVICCFMPLSF